MIQSSRFLEIVEYSFEYDILNISPSSFTIWSRGRPGYQLNEAISLIGYISSY